MKIYIQLLVLCLFVNLHKVLSQEIITAHSVEINHLQKKKLDEKIRKYQLVSLSKIPTQSQSEILQFQILFSNETWNVELFSNEIRSKNLVDEMKRNATLKGATAQCATYTSTVNNEEANFYVDRKTLVGKIYKKNDALVLEPLAWLIGKQSTQNDIWVLYYDDDVISQPAICGVKNTQTTRKPNGGRIANNLPSECKILNIAIDYDEEFANRIAGGNPVAKALSIMQEVDRIYFRDFKTKVNVCWIASSPFVFSNTNNAIILVPEFWNYWNNNRGNVIRDAAHMLTGKRLVAINGSIESNGEANQVLVGSTAKSYSMSDGGDETNSDWASCASHEIAHNLNAIHDSDCTSKYIMCEGKAKNGQFSPTSISMVVNFLNSNNSLSIRTPSIQPRLNNINIISTPTYMPTSGQTFSIISNDTYVTNNTFVYSANNTNVSYIQGANPTFLFPNSAPYFTFTIQYSNICGTFYRSIPLIARSGARLAIIPDSTTDNLTIYPNPTTENMNIKIETSDSGKKIPIEIKIHDENQNLVYQKETLSETEGIYQINLSDKTKGRYFVHILFSDGSIHKQTITLIK